MQARLGVHRTVVRPRADDPSLSRVPYVGGDFCGRSASAMMLIEKYLRHSLFPCDCIRVVNRTPSHVTFSRVCPHS